MHYNSKVFFYF